MAREFDRERGREICERLNVRPELRHIVIGFFDEGGAIIWRTNNMFVDFLKECFAEDDLKGIIALEMLYSHFWGACIGEERHFDRFKDTVNAFYEINDMYILYFFLWIR